MTEPIFYRYPESRPEPFATWWVCDCCMFAREGDGDGCDGNGGCEGNPWANLAEVNLHITHRYTVTAGLLNPEHMCHWETVPKDDYCYCEHREFVASSCDGCGSPLHGARHAYTVWLEERL